MSRTTDFNGVAPRYTPTKTRRKPRRNKYGYDRGNYGGDESDSVSVHSDSSTVYQQQDLSHSMPVNNRFNMYLNYNGQPRNVDRQVSSPGIDRARSYQPRPPKVDRTQTAPVDPYESRVVVHTEDIELANSQAAVYQAPHFPQTARNSAPPASQNSRPYRPPSYYQKPVYDSQSTLPRRVVLSVFALLNLIIIVFAFVSFWSVWSATTTYDEGQSGIVIWQEVTKFEYYLRDYQDLTTNEITTYENVANDDYRNDCSLSGRNTAALVGMSLAMAIIGLACALVHLCLPNVDAWDNKTRCLSLSMLITAFFSVFFVMLGVGFWWFGCHNDMIVHADAVSWSSVVARVYTDIKVGTGFALSFINCGIGILSTSWFAAFYRRG